MEEAIGLASDDKVTERNRLKRYLRILARPCRIEEIRAALSDIDLLAPGNEPQLGRYLDVCRGLRLPWKVI